MSVMNIWSILFVLSIATCLVGGGIAILEYLQKQGNATRQKQSGILALVAAFVLLLLGFVHSYLDVQVSRRAMERFEKVVANFEVSVKGNAPGIAAYRDRLQSGDQPCLQRADVPDGTIRTEEPSCQPQSTEEPVASDVLSANVLFLDFFKKPAVDCGEPPNAPADLTMEFPVSIRDHTLRLVYDRQQDVFLLKGRLALSQWKSPTGAIAAPTDLLGSEMVASLHGLGFQAEARNVYRSMELRYLDMNLAGSHSYELPLGPKLQRLRREDGYPAYSYCFPSAGL